MKDEEPVEFPNYRVVISDAERQIILHALLKLRQAEAGWTKQAEAIEAKLGGQPEGGEETGQ